MAVTLLCPNLKCRKVLAVPEETRGQRVRCRYCSLTFMVPVKGHSSTAKESKETKEKAPAKK